MKRALIFAATLSLIALPAIVLAQTQSCQGANGFVPLACGNGTMLQSAYQSGTLSQYFNALFQIALSIGAILAVFQIVRAGYLYMLKDSFSVKQDAKEIFGDAIIGLLILLSVWLILDQIDPNILNFNISNSNDFSSGAATAPTNGAAGGL